MKSAQGCDIECKTAPSAYNYLFNGKELQDEMGIDWYDYEARFYDPVIGRWHTQDPHAENYLNWTPYNYVANNPLLLIDPNGMDWFYYKAEGDDDASYHWHDEEDEYEHTYSYMDKDGNEQTATKTLTGVDAVVVFNGYWDEKLGSKNGKSGYIDGEGAQAATVTVYGPNGEDDIGTYTGYTMTSNSDIYSVVAPGEYNADYDAIGSSNSLYSNWALNNRGNVPSVWWGGGEPLLNPQYPGRGNPGYMNGIFIHSTADNGFAGIGSNGKAVSTGCLLIASSHWQNFNNQLRPGSSSLQKAINIKVQINRGYVKNPHELMK